MAKRDTRLFVDDVVRLVGCLVDTAHSPGRMSDVELGGLLCSFNELLTRFPEIHRRDSRFFVFHQELITEHEQRTGVETVLSVQVPGQLGFDDLVSGVVGVEVAY